MIPKTMQQGFVTIVEQACESVRISYNSCRDRHCPRLRESVG